MSENQRQFPVLFQGPDAPRLREMGCPESVPWELVSARCRRLEWNCGWLPLACPDPVELAAAWGGLTPSELVALLRDEPWGTSVTTDGEAVPLLLEILAQEPSRQEELPGLDVVGPASTDAPATVRETSRSIVAWSAETFGAVTLDRAILRAREEMREFKEVVFQAAYTPGYESAILDECADVVICLARVAALVGGDLDDAVAKKMVINRGRKWRLDGRGCGYHVKDGE